MPKTKDKVAGVAGTAKPYVERALRDEELREHVKQAYSAARRIYGELIGPRRVTGLASRVATDRDLQENLRTAIGELRQSANRLQGRREAHAGRTVALLVGAAVGLLFNPITGPATRRWLTEKLFGKDEFGYEPSSGNGAG